MLWGWLWTATPGEPQIVVLVFDAASGTSAGLWLGDTESAPVDTFRMHEGGLWTVMTGKGSPEAERDGLASGYTRGAEAAAQMLVANLPFDLRADAVAAWVGAMGTATFEASHATGVVLHHRSPTIVLGRDLPRAWVHDWGRQLGAVPREPQASLLAAASIVEERWPRRGGPRSGLLVACGPGQAPEVIAVDRHGAVSRRLVERHLLHLARVEVPYQMARARTACARDVPSCAQATRALMGVARRALQGRPDDAEVLEALAEAEELSPL